MDNKIIEIINEQSRENLSDIFCNFTKEDLIRIAKLHHIKKYSSLKKDELVDYVINGILDKQELEAYFLLLGDIEVQSFEALMKESVELTADNQGEYEYLLSGGYLALSYDMKVVVPSDVRQAWLAMNSSSFKKLRQRVASVREYATALNYLYGITPTNVFLNVFNFNEKIKLTEEELVEILEMIGRYDNRFHVMDKLIIDSILLENNEYIEIQKQVEGKSYFVPNKEMITNLGNPFDSRISQELYELYLVLANKYELDEYTTITLCELIEDNIRLGCTMNEVFDMLQSSGIQYQTKKDMEEMRDLLANLWNNTRMILNLGFTPTELVEVNNQIGQKVVPFKKEEDKVYPNQPCPCGSGKKYKQCCKSK